MKTPALILLLALSLSACASARLLSPQEVEVEEGGRRRLMGGAIGLPAPLCYSGAYASPAACCAELVVSGLKPDSSCRKHAVPFKQQCGLLPKNQWESCCYQRWKKDRYDWSCRDWTVEYAATHLRRKLMGGAAGLPAPLCYSGAYAYPTACCAELAIDNLPVDSSCRKHAVPLKQQCGLLPKNKWESCCYQRWKKDQYDWSCRHWTVEYSASH